jgi:general L-amino acid transport system permease protein
MSSTLDAGVVRFNAARETGKQQLRGGLFNSPLNAVVTILVIAGVTWLAVAFFRWAVIDATWSGTSQDCQANGGACWAFVGANIKLIVFATYPSDLLWRPAVGMAMILSVMLGSMVPRLWGRWLVLAWIAVPAVVCVLLSGFPGTIRMPTSNWGGLPLTLLVWAIAYATAFPIAIPLALARRSGMGGIRGVTIGFIELLRGMPMVVVLYVSSLIVPMMLPFIEVNLFLSIEVALTLFVACYLAEVIRAGIQALPAGQGEAAQALGLSYWQTVVLVVLPQALRIVIPPLVNLGIGILLSTPLVGFVGMIDFLTAVRMAASQEQIWPRCYGEAYCFAGLVYFTICFAASRYSLWLERRTKAAHGP